MFGFIYRRIVPFLSVAQVFSHFLAPYVENLDMRLVNLGIVQGKSIYRFQDRKRHDIVCGLGQVTLRKLRIKKGVLDAFRLPVDVSEGEDRHYLRVTSANAEEQAIWGSFLCPYTGLI